MNNYPVARIAVRRSTTYPIEWGVTFTLYCGGCHLCTCGVRIDGAQPLMNTIEVAGTPPLKSRIMRGPGWNDITGITSHNYGASTSDVGLVTKHNASMQTITVQWQDGECFDYRWGRSGEFEVQLYH
jgi:hypothetical protein